MTRGYAFALAVGASVAEIAIIVIEFVLFLSAPEWTMWTTNWFINILFVLACFWPMLSYFALTKCPGRALQRN